MHKATKTQKKKIKSKLKAPSYTKNIDRKKKQKKNTILEGNV